MTVKQLKEKLEGVDDDTEVVVTKYLTKYGITVYDEPRIDTEDDEPDKLFIS